MSSTYGSVNSREESGVHRSAPKRGDRTEELKVITEMPVEGFNFIFYVTYRFYVINYMHA